MPYPPKRLSCEIITGGPQLRPSFTNVWIHSIILIYFIVWGTLYTFWLHLQAPSNAWNLSFVASGTGFIGIIAILASTSIFESSNISSNIHHHGMHYTSGLVLVGLVIETSIISFFSILIPSLLQFLFLIIKTPCCSWKGSEFINDPSFIATYIISIFYYNFGALQMIKLIIADLRPVWQVTELWSKHSKKKIESK